MISNCKRFKCAIFVKRLPILYHTIRLVLRKISKNSPFPPFIKLPKCLPIHRASQSINTKAMSSQIIHFEPYEIDTAAARIMDSGMKSDTIISNTDPLEPLDYTRDWSREMKSTCADILPHLIDLDDRSSRSLYSIDSDTSSRSITGWATNEKESATVQETSTRLQNNVYVTERRFSRVPPNNTNRARRRPSGTN